LEVPSAERGPASLIAAWRGSTVRPVIVAALLLLVAPLLIVHDVPLYDLPDHLARMHLLYDAAPADAPTYYLARWRPIPNLALEAGVFLLHFVVSIDLAVRIFLIATVLQLFLGTIALNRALFGRGSRPALAASLFVFNGPLLFGFINLSFGIGLALWVFALWILRRQKPWDWLIFPILATAILFCHLFAFAVYGLAVGTFAVADGWGRLKGSEGSADAARALLRDLLPLVVPVLIYLAIVPPELANPTIHYSSLADKIGAILSVDGFYNAIFDAVCLAAFGIGAILLRRHLTMARGMILPLAALITAFVVLPHQIGVATFVDFRLPSVIALFLVGSVSWRASGDAIGRRAEIFVLGLLLTRTVVMGVQWATWQPLFDEYRTAFASLPVGATLLPLQPDPDEINRRQHPPLAHIAALAVAERHALIPSLFAGLGHELLSYAPAYDPLRQADPTAEHADDFDYVLVIRPEDLAVGAIPPYEAMAHGRTFILGRLTHGPKS
jgi:hypothetical protein